MSSVGLAIRVANGEVVGRGTLSNAGSVSTKSKNRAPSGGGRHPLPTEDHEGMAVGAAVGLVAAAVVSGVPPATMLLP
jgi:hypothetical protein